MRLNRPVQEAKGKTNMLLLCNNAGNVHNFFPPLRQNCINHFVCIYMGLILFLRWIYFPSSSLGCWLPVDSPVRLFLPHLRGWKVAVGLSSKVLPPLYQVVAWQMIISRVVHVWVNACIVLLELLRCRCGDAAIIWSGQVLGSFLPPVHTCPLNIVHCRQMEASDEL